MVRDISGSLESDPARGGITQITDFGNGVEYQRERACADPSEVLNPGQISFFHPIYLAGAGFWPGDSRCGRFHILISEYL
ncbi:hypothetical protein DQW77_12320 [Roseovarius sp. TE539]|nr:hypothetical protein DQW77_12320 [Roseovarius sp. TE539]